MNKLLAATGCLLILLSCQKEQLKPNAENPSVTHVREVEKDMAKRKLYCNLSTSSGTIVFHGTKCTNSGNECNRASFCTARIGGLIEYPDEVIYDGMTRQQLADMWEDDKGRAYLTEQGFYETEEQ